MRRRGRLLTWALEERSWVPRVLRSERVYLSLFFCFCDRMEAMSAAETRNSTEKRVYELNVIC